MIHMVNIYNLVIHIQHEASNVTMDSNNNNFNENHEVFQED